MELSEKRSAEDPTPTESSDAPERTPTKPGEETNAQEFVDVEEEEGVKALGPDTPEAIENQDAREAVALESGRSSSEEERTFEETDAAEEAAATQFVKRIEEERVVSSKSDEEMRVDDASGVKPKREVQLTEEQVSQPLQKDGNDEQSSSSTASLVVSEQITSASSETNDKKNTVSSEEETPRTTEKSELPKLNGNESSEPEGRPPDVQEEEEDKFALESSKQKPVRHGSRATLSGVKFVGIDDRLPVPEDSLEKLALQLEMEAPDASESQPEESQLEPPPTPTSTALDDARRAVASAWRLLHETQSFSSYLPNNADWLMRHTKAAEVLVLELAEVQSRLQDAQQDIDRRRRSSSRNQRNTSLAAPGVTASLESLAATDAKMTKSIYLHESSVRQLRQAVAAAEQQEQHDQLIQILQQEEAAARALQKQKAAIDASIKKTGYEIQKLERDAADQKRLQEEKNRLDDQVEAALAKERQLQAQIDAVEEALEKHQQRVALLHQRQEGLQRLVAQHGVSAQGMVAAVRELRLAGVLSTIPTAKDKLLFLLSERRKRRQQHSEQMEEMNKIKEALLSQLEVGAFERQQGVV